jgi:cell division transport system permease protein
MNTKQGRQPTFIYSIISLTLVLFLVGCLLLGWLHLQQVVEALRARVTVLVELYDHADPAEVNNLKTVLNQLPGIQSGSLTFLPKDVALEMMQEELGTGFLDSTLQNPLQDAFSMYLEPQYVHEDSMVLLRGAIRKSSVVSDVSMQSPAFESFEKNIRTLLAATALLVVLFLLISFVLIHNTNRLALYTNRLVIKNMELVGASWRFISRPYIVRGMVHGMISGLLASSGLIGLWLWLNRTIPDFADLPIGIERPILVGLIVVVLGVILTALSTYLVVYRFLRMRLDDLI